MKGNGMSSTSTDHHVGIKQFEAGLQGSDRSPHAAGKATQKSLSPEGGVLLPDKRPALCERSLPEWAETMRTVSSVELGPAQRPKRNRGGQAQAERTRNRISPIWHWNSARMV